jgi:deoxycytidylate deaminase
MDRVVTKSRLKQEFLRQAFAVALSSNSQIKMGAIIIKRRRVIAASSNYDYKTHPIQSWWAHKTAEIYGEPFSQRIYLHAEIGALIKAKENADTIVICRVGGHSGRELRNARPCVICEGFIRHSGIGHIHYSTNQGFLYENWI